MKLITPLQSDSKVLTLSSSVSIDHMDLEILLLNMLFHYLINSNTLCPYRVMQ